jgi:general secretion pathway protein H
MPTPLFPGRSRPRVRRLRDQGFTLIELLVVMTIVAILMAVVPAFTAGLSGARLNAAADGLIERLRQVRDAAIRRGTTTDAAFDLDTRSYTTSLSGSAIRLPPVVESVAFRRQTPVRAAGQALLQFFPDGSATAGAIRLVHGSQSVLVTIDWVTGRIERHD